MRRLLGVTVVGILIIGLLSWWLKPLSLLPSSANGPVYLIRQLSAAYPAFVRRSAEVDTVFANGPPTPVGRSAARALAQEADRIGRLAARLQEALAVYAAQHEGDTWWNKPITEDQWVEWLHQAEADLHREEIAQQFVSVAVTPFLSNWEPATDLHSGWSSLQWDLQQLQVTTAVAASIASVLANDQIPGILPNSVAKEIDRYRTELIDLASAERVPWGAVREAAAQLRVAVEKGLRYAPEEPRLLAIYQLAALIHWAASAPPADFRSIPGVRWWSHVLALESLGSVEEMALYDHRLVADARVFRVEGTVHETVLQRVARGSVVAVDFLIPDPTIVAKGSKVYKAAKKAYLVGNDIVLATKGGKKLSQGLDISYKLVDGGLDLKNVWEIAEPFVMGGIPGVQVDVKMDRQTALQIVTGNNGWYGTPDLKPASYVFGFSHDKYEPEELQVTVASYWRSAYVDGLAVSLEDDSVVEADVALQKRTMKALADHGLNLAGTVAQAGGILLCVVGIVGAIETVGASLVLCGVGAGMYAGGSELQELADDPESEFTVRDYREESQKPQFPIGPALPYAEFRPLLKPEPVPSVPVIRAMPAPPLGTTSTMFVLDVSPSMDEASGRGSRLQAAVDAVQSLIQVLAFDARETRRPHEIGVVVFGGSAQLAHPLNSDYSRAIGSLKGIANIDATNVGDGLAMALEEVAYGPGARTIILLTDGETNTGLTPDEILVGPAAEAASQNVTVHSVGFGVQDTLLAQIAGRTGGEYVSIADSFSLQRHYLKLAHQTQGQVIGDLSGRIGPSETVEAGTVQVGTGELYATLVWPGSDMDLILIDPAGRRVDADYPGARVMWDGRPKQVLIEAPLPGRWTVQVKGVEVPAGGEPYAIILSQRHDPPVALEAGIVSAAGLLVVLSWFAFLSRGLSHHP